jgi:hypothetical protein
MRRLPGGLFSDLRITMPLPALSQWDTTRDSLHRASQIVGLARKAFLPPQPNALHLALFVNDKGLTTGVLPDGSEFTLDFINLRVEMRSGDTLTLLPLARYHYHALRIALMSAMPTLRHPVNLLLPMERDAKPFELNADHARDYAAALNTIYTALARFRARLLGSMTPLVVWPHGFDLSFLYFADRPPDEHTEPHLNFGFSPFSAGFPRPYLYAYISPLPAGRIGKPLPAPARWHEGTWKGVVMDYDLLVNDPTAGEDSPESMIESRLMDIFRVLEPGLKPVVGAPAEAGASPEAGSPAGRAETPATTESKVEEPAAVESPSDAAPSKQ